MLKEGDRLAAFSLQDQEGRPRTLKDLAGPKGLVLYFYPKDNTPGCTLEAQDFRDHAGDFSARGFGVAGVSKDSVKSHCGFAEKYGLTFPLLSDAEGVLLEAAGAWQEKKNYGRTYMGIVRSTVVVDPKGKVLKVYPKVSAKGHAQKVLEDLEG